VLSGGRPSFNITLGIFLPIGSVALVLDLDSPFSDVEGFDVLMFGGSSASSCALMARPAFAFALLGEAAGLMAFESGLRASRSRSFLVIGNGGVLAPAVDVRTLGSSSENTDRVCVIHGSGPAPPTDGLPPRRFLLAFSS
jgi:hypothetical protein